MRHVAAITAACLGLSALTAAATAERRDERSSVFRGPCQFTGVLKQDPPLTNLPDAGEGVRRVRVGISLASPGITG